MLYNSESLLEQRNFERYLIGIQYRIQHIEQNENVLHNKLDLRKHK